MPNITFSVDEILYERMKAHPEIKWTEIYRQSIKDFLVKTDSNNTIITIIDFRKQLSKELLDRLKSLDEEKSILFVKEMKKLDQERLDKIRKFTEEES